MIVSTQSPNGRGHASYIFNMEAHVQTTMEYAILCEKGETIKPLRHLQAHPNKFIFLTHALISKQTFEYVPSIRAFTPPPRHLHKHSWMYLHPIQTFT